MHPVIHSATILYVGLITEVRFAEDSEVAVNLNSTTRITHHQPGGVQYLTYRSVLTPDALMKSPEPSVDDVKVKVVPDLLEYLALLPSGRYILPYLGKP